jgi:hypothetical protein
MVLSAEKESLGAERAEEPGEAGVDIAELDRRSRRVVAVRAHLETCPRGEEDDTAGRIGVEEVGRKIARGRRGVRDPIPVDLSTAVGEGASHAVVGSQKGPESIDCGLDISRAGS